MLVRAEAAPWRQGQFVSVLNLGSRVDQAEDRIGGLDLKARRFDETQGDHPAIRHKGKDFEPDKVGPEVDQVASAHLERLGLATRIGPRFQLDAELEAKLRALQTRKDVIRTLNQRRLEGAREVRELGSAAVRGRVVRIGFHDELGAAPFVVVHDRNGVEYYAKLGFGHAPPELGRTVDLVRTDRGALAIGRAGVAQELGRQ